MKIDKARKTQFVVLLAAVFSVAMIVFPEVTETGSKTAIVLWINSIVPVLLPFFIFSDFIKRTGDLDRLPASVYPFVVAFLSGYPMGAKIVGDFIKEKKVTVNQGRYILSYSLVTGPAFIIFTIGNFIGSQKAAAVIAIAHYVGALINGFFYRNHEEKKEKRKGGGRPPKGDYLENFTDAIVSGFKAMAMILAYLMVFTIGINILEHLGVFSVINNQGVAASFKGIFEMTIGINLVGMCDMGIRLKSVIAAFLVSFGGLSVAGQSMSMARGSGIGLADILKIKLTHGMIAAIITTIPIHIVVI